MRSRIGLAIVIASTLFWLAVVPAMSEDAPPPATPTATAAAATTAPNLALGKIAVATTVYASATNEWIASRAVDGDLATRWASARGVDPQAIQVDLGASYAIDHVVLNWGASAKQYSIEVSQTGAPGTWLGVYATDLGDGGVDDFTFTRTAPARYVRMIGQTRNDLTRGYALVEFAVYEAARTSVSGEVYCPTSPVTCIKYPQTMVYSQTNVDRRFRWGGMPATSYAQVELLEFPPKAGQVAVASAVLPLGAQLWTFQIHSAGLYWLRMRECKAANTLPVTYTCDDTWRDSTDPAQTDQTLFPRGFILYAKLPPPSGGGAN